MATEWSQLPQDLLDQITKKIPSTIDLVRFRSVCSTWRSSITYPIHTFPNKIPIRPSNFDSGLFHLSKRLILHVSSPSNQQNEGWIIKLEQDDSNLSHLLNPLSESKIQPLPETFPKHFDILNLRVFELCQEYVLRYADKWPLSFAGDVYREKVIFSPTPPWSNEMDYVIMTIHVSGKLALFRLKDNVWSIIDEMPNPYEDVIHFKGRFYAVDGTGRAVVVAPDLTISEVAGPVFGGDKKYLVEMDGELLLVDRYLKNGNDDLNFWNDNEIYVPNDDTYVMDTTLLFIVYRLDKWEKTWVELKNLGDRLLFLSDNCSFCAPASDLYGSKGNCIYFTDRYFQSFKVEETAFNRHSIGVFSLENGSIAPLASYAGYSQLFWPPPMWITATTS
ncbi:hypothetical protein IFM89_015093 [Coptis chinensis]|uniref:F-box domain-containing protein n=1 Tax=Coptis chinensis TaxID=261450 RepID=A0A835IR91_9MAGN|nr:hypothetical protein IFM89_015093 [Coptis chinensis]